MLKLPPLFTLITCLILLVQTNESRANEFAINSDDYSPANFDAYLNEPNVIDEKLNSTSSQPVLLFINLNLNPKEALAVKRVANATGLKLVSFPNDELFKIIYPSYAKYLQSDAKMNQNEKRTSVLYDIEEKTHNRNKLTAIRKQISQIDKRDDELQKEKYASLDTAQKLALDFFHVAIPKEQDYYSSDSSINTAYTEALAQLVKSLESQNAILNTLVISGHHGGGFFGTATFNLDSGQFDIHEALKPLAQNLKTIALWGCDTVNQNSAELWLKSAPNFTTMFGYSDTAPLGAGNASASFLESGLMASTRLLAVGSKVELKSKILKIPGVIETSAAVLVRSPTLGDILFSSTISGDYHSGSVVLKHEIEDLKNSLRCSIFSSKLATLLADVSPYMTGSSPLPEDETVSPLKRAYFELHHNQDCYHADYDTIYDTYQVGLLRFFETDVKFNIALALNDKFIEAEAEIKNANDASLKLKNTSFFTLLTQTNRPEMLKTLNELFVEPTTTLPKTSSLFEALKKLVVNLDSRAMNFDQWHMRSSLALPVTL